MEEYLISRKSSLPKSETSGKWTKSCEENLESIFSPGRTDYHRCTSSVCAVRTEHRLLQKIYSVIRGRKRKNDDQVGE